MEKMGFEESFELIAERLKRRETDRLLKREAERQQESARKRGEKEQSAASNEQIHLFLETFNEKRHEIETALEEAAAGSVETEELPYHFDKIVKSVQSLQNFISASTYFLRVYDIRKSQESIQSLQQRCQELEDQLLPKKKFGFKLRKVANKSKKESYSCKIEDCVDSPVVSVDGVSKAAQSENLCGFSQRVGETLLLNHEGVFKKDVVLADLQGCTVRLQGAPATLQMTGLRGCRVACGPVASSVFIDACSDCSLVLACQQLRVHNTRHCDVHLHVTSRAVIEDSKEIRFAPFRWMYPDADLHCQLAGLDANRNNWDFIDDFNWLASDKPSPHWRVLPVREQRPDWL